jgi:hypothetical protein
MSDRIVTGIFQDSRDADKVIRALKQARFKTQDISVVGRDTDDFRTITAQLQSKGPDRYVLIFGAVGAFLGGLSWLIAMWALPTVGSTTLIGPPLALLSGGSIGAVLGIIAGAVIHFDTPEYAGRVYEGDLSVGKALVAVHTTDVKERIRAENIMEQNNAYEVSSASVVAVLAGLDQLKPLIKVP